jgi:hypothetical protein
MPAGAAAGADECRSVLFMRSPAHKRSAVGLGAALAAITVLAAGCGGSSAATRAPSNAAVPASVTADYRATYSGIIAGYNRASGAFDQNKSFAKDNVKPFIDAIQKSDKELLAVEWPAVVETDILALVAQDRAVTSDLSKGNGTRFNTDAGKDALIATKLRTDLGFTPSGH